MSQSNSIVDKVDAVLTAARWPEGLSPVQGQKDIQAVTALMNAKLAGGKAAAPALIPDPSGPGPHG